MSVLTGRKYKHFKGNIYKILYIAINTETHEEEVIYKNIDNTSTTIWARPLEIFDNYIIDDNGNRIKRFTLIEESD